MTATLVDHYTQDRDDLLHGQLKFKELLATQFQRCWDEIAKHGFQTGWKNVTGKPQHGNHNPNWKDCLDFVEACFRNGKHQTDDCPDLPILKDLPVNRGAYLRGEYWRHMWDVCKLHQEAIRYCRRAKRAGLIGLLYQQIRIRLTTTDYILMLLNSDTEGDD